MVAWLRWPSTLRVFAILCLCVVVVELYLLVSQERVDLQIQGDQPINPEVDRFVDEPGVEIDTSCTGSFFPNVLSYNESLDCTTKNFIFTSYKTPISDLPKGLEHFNSFTFSRYKFVYFDDDDMTRFITRHFPDLLQYYEMIPKKLPAIRSDVFRLLLLKQYGGSWTDFDNQYERFDEEFLDEHPNILIRSWWGLARKVKLGEQIYTAFMKLDKDLPFLQDLIDRAIDHLRLNTWYDCMEIAGPIGVHGAILRHFNIPTLPTTAGRIPVRNGTMIFHDGNIVKICEEFIDVATKAPMASCNGSIVFGRDKVKDHGSYSHNGLCIERPQLHHIWNVNRTPAERFYPPTKPTPTPATKSRGRSILGLN